MLSRLELHLRMFICNQINEGHNISLTNEKPKRTWKRNDENEKHIELILIRIMHLKRKEKRKHIEITRYKMSTETHEDTLKSTI